MKRITSVLLILILCFGMMACETARKDRENEEDETTRAPETVDLAEKYGLLSQLGYKNNGICNICGKEVVNEDGDKVEMGALCSDCVANNTQCIVCHEDLYTGETLICESCLKDINNAGGKIPADYDKEDLDDIIDRFQ